MQLAELLTLYLATNPRISSPETGRRYRTTINTVSRFLGRPATTADLTPDNYGRWCNARREQVSPNTLAGDAEKLLVLWKWAARRGFAELPDVAVPKKQYKTPIAYTDAEVDALRDAARKCTWLVGQTPAAVFWPALIELLYDTAERIDAVHRLHRSGLSLDGESPSVLFPACDRKGQSGDSSRPLRTHTAALVRDLLAYSGDRPFAPVKLKTLYPCYRRLLAEAGVSVSRTKMFHAWRRRHASDLTASGLDATVALGHSSRAVTVRSYIDPSVAMSRGPLEKLREQLKARPSRRWFGLLG